MEIPDNPSGTFVEDEVVQKQLPPPRRCEGLAGLADWAHRELRCFKTWTRALPEGIIHTICKSAHNGRNARPSTNSCTGKSEHGKSLRQTTSTTQGEKHKRDYIQNSGKKRTRLLAALAAASIAHASKSQDSAKKTNETTFKNNGPARLRVCLLLRVPGAQVSVYKAVPGLHFGYVYFPRSARIFG